MTSNHYRVLERQALVSLLMVIVLHFIINPKTHSLISVAGNGRSREIHGQVLKVCQATHAVSHLDIEISQILIRFHYSGRNEDQQLRPGGCLRCGAE